MVVVITVALRLEVLRHGDLRGTHTAMTVEPLVVNEVVDSRRGHSGLTLQALDGDLRVAVRHRLTPLGMVLVPWTGSLSLSAPTGAPVALACTAAADSAIRARSTLSSMVLELKGGDRGECFGAYFFNGEGLDLKVKQILSKAVDSPIICLILG